MKIELNRKTLIKLACFALLLMVLPFSFELILLVDIGGFDLALTFLMVYLGSVVTLLQAKWDNFKREVAAFVLFVSQLYMFRPRVFLPHLAVSSLVVSLTCSLFLACLFWVPLMYVSSGFIA